MDFDRNDDLIEEDDEPVELPPDAAGYLALLDEHHYFDDLPPSYVAQARAGVEAAYARGDHPAVGLAIHSVAHSDDAEPVWFGTMLKAVVAGSHGLTPLTDAKVTKNKRGDYVAKAKLGEQQLQETIYDAQDPELEDPILSLAVLLETALEAQGIEDKNFGYFTDDAKVLHWYLRPREIALPAGLIPDDVSDPLFGDADADGEDEDEDEGENE